MTKEFVQYRQLCDACETINDTTAMITSRGDGWHKIGDKDLCPLCYSKLIFGLDKMPGFTEYLDKFIEETEVRPSHDIMLMGGIGTITTDSLNVSELGEDYKQFTYC